MADLPMSLNALFEEERERFQSARRVLSFDEYVALFAANPQRFARDAARWLRDMFDHYGTTTVERPYGRFTRWNLFDLPWEDESGRGEALVSHEPLQAELYRALSNFVRQRRVNRLVLLHGPNGSAKSTFVASLMRAMENYSSTDEGALYRYNWVFPRGRGGDGSRIGFGGGGREDGPRAGESYALLDEGAIDARVQCELRDHPLLILPVAMRQSLLREALGEDAASLVPVELWKGGACHKCQQVFSALHTAYRGDLRKALAHVQVERWYVSRRYRVGAVTLGPQMAVDARERQVTASRSLAALPSSLQYTALFEPSGELVDAAGGLIEYSDLLKRSLEHWKYLLLLIETGEVSLEASNLVPNVVMVGSSNEGHLDAFREHPEFASFRGRLDLVRAPYLTDWTAEKAIYDAQALPGVRRHVAPHTTEMAALFAVLTRMKKPANDPRFSRPLASLAGDLSPVEKADLYATGAVPARLSGEQAKELRAGVAALYHESDVHSNYEGRTGASPREMRSVILDAAQHPGYRCLSPFAVLDRIADLCNRKTEFEWLRQETVAGGFHDPKYFMKVLRERLIEELEDELRSASGLVDEARYVEGFERYVFHVSAQIKGEKIRNKHTGRDEAADEAMLKETERAIAIVGPPDEFRRNVISRLAAWAIDHPGEKVPYTKLFPNYIQRLKEVFFQDHRRQVVQHTRELMVFLTEEGSGLDADARRRAEATMAFLKDRYGYCEHCASDAAATLLKDRFADVKG